MCFAKPFSYITRRKEKKRRREAGRKRGSKERERGVSKRAKKGQRRDDAEVVRLSEAASSVGVEHNQYFVKKSHSSINKFPVLV